MGLVIDDKLDQRHSIKTGPFPVIMVFYNQLPQDTDRGVRAPAGSLAVVINKATGNAFLAIKAAGTWEDVQTDLEVTDP